MSDAKIPLVLLPGTLCDSLLWAHQIGNLSDVASIMAGDLTRDDSIEGMARTVLEQAPEQFALAGLSMGGIVAMEIMRQSPERVLKLALLDTNPNPPRPEQIANWNKFIAMAHNNQFMEITQQYLLPGLIHPDRLQDEQLVQTILQMAENVGAPAMVKQMTALKTRKDMRGQLPNIRCPSLILAGRQDALCPVSWHEEMAAAIPHSRLVVVEHCGHLSTLEQPEQVTAALREWLGAEIRDEKA